VPLTQVHLRQDSDTSRRPLGKHNLVQHECHTFDAITADKLFFGHDICGTGGWEAPA
jgi:hypothetical protein